MTEIPRDQKKIEMLFLMYLLRHTQTQITKQTKQTMAATIMMPQQIEVAIREMCSDAMSQAVAALADKYGFDQDEANRFLAASDVKIVRKRGPSPKPDKDSKKDAKPKADKSDKPKRGKTGYLLYADEVRAEVKAELLADLGEDDKLKPQDVVKAIAARWKAEDEDVRAEWNAKAKTPVTSDDETVVATPKAVKAKPQDAPPAPKAEKSKSKTKGKVEQPAVSKMELDSESGSDSDSDDDN